MVYIPSDFLPAVALIFLDAALGPESATWGDASTALRALPRGTLGAGAIRLGGSCGWSGRLGPPFDGAPLVLLVREPKGWPEELFDLLFRPWLSTLPI